MHELSVCQALVQQLQAVSANNGGGRVALVRLRIGPLSGIEPALLQHAFPIAAAGSIAAGAELLIEQAAVTVRCSDCGEVTVAAVNRMLCAACSSFRVRLASGDEMLLESVELTTTGTGRAGML